MSMTDTTGLQRTGLDRRGFLAGALALSPALLVGLGPETAEAATRYPIHGAIKRTYSGFGGSKVFGAPLAAEVKRVIDGRNTYSQRFQRGIVWWGSNVGRADVTAGTRVHLTTSLNFRPVDGVRGAWRCAGPDKVTPLEKRVIADLGITTLIAMDAASDPKIPGVGNYYSSVRNDGTREQFYRSYVTDAANRAGLGRVFAKVAASSKPVLVHCAGGKDRTGWVCDVLAALAGVSMARRDASYLASAKKEYGARTVDLDWLGYSRSEVAARYGSLESYLVDGCGLTRLQLTMLRDRV